jgi:hypothetical protein
LRAAAGGAHLDDVAGCRWYPAGLLGHVEIIANRVVFRDGISRDTEISAPDEPRRADQSAEHLGDRAVWSIVHDERPGASAVQRHPGSGAIAGDGDVMDVEPKLGERVA